MSRWKRWLSGFQILSEYKAAWFSARCDGRSGADYYAGASRHRLCVGFGRSRNLWTVCHDCALARVRGVWSQSHSCARTRFVSRTGDSRGRAPPVRWRRHPCGSHREYDGGHLGSGVRIDRCVAPRLHHGAPPQAGRYGYMNGIALTVLISQLPKLLGFSIDDAGPLRDLLRITEGVLGGKVNWTSFAVGAGTLAAILLLKPYKRIPGLLLAVIAATIVVGILSLEATAGVKVLGPLPQGLPSFQLPMISFAHLDEVIVGGCAVAMVAFADTSVLSRTYAARTRTPVDPNQEMIGLGAANLAAGLFQGFPISSSSSRTPVAEAAGAKTQLTGVVGAIAVALLLVCAPNLLKDLPSSALAAVVIAAAIGLFEFADLHRIFRIQQWEFWLSIVCFVGVAVFGVIPGIGSAIGIAVIEFLWDGWRPHFAVLGRVDGVRGYHDIKRYPAARRIPGLVLFRWDAPLFFANAELFHQRVLAALAESPTPVRRIILTAEPVTDIDVTSADMLAELVHTLTKSGIELRCAELKDPVKDKLRRFELFERFGSANFYPTIGSAVDGYLEEHAVGWKP